MNARPAPRKSSLAGSSPVVPPAAIPVEQPRTIEEPQQTSVVPGRKKHGHKVSFYQDEADTARVRGALLHTQVAEGTRSLSQFIDRAVMAEVERLERKYNGGQPFPSVKTGVLPQGRPIGE